MEKLTAYIPLDRRLALTQGLALPERCHGAALFADISGFTPLTEAMMQALGPSRGPDELTRQINRVYEALISQVHRFQGSVLTFSGDAITCWFDDLFQQPTVPGSLRATVCGLAMQQAMAQFASVETPAGQTVSLGMKAAVATGPARRFLIGDPQIHYLDVLAGATLDRMAAAEHQAERGEVVVCSDTAARLGERLQIAEWRQDEEDNSSYAVVTGLTRPVDPTPWPALTPEQEQTLEAQIQSWLLPPVYHRLHSSQGQFLAEVRPAVALFLNFSGLNYDEDETASHKLDAYIRWVQRVLVRYESYLFQLTIGDKGSYLYAAFGAPLTHGDDELRAMAAAQNLRSPPPELGFDFIRDIKIGVSQGRVRAGAYGGPARRTYGALGDEVNTAARLMGQARAGEIIISSRLAATVAGYYHLEDVGAITLKGKAEPLPVHRVLDRRFTRPLRPALTRYQRPLVGRQQELSELKRLLERVATGQGQIIRLEGPAGVGKSHLAAALVEWAMERGFQAALGASHSTSESVYGPWQHIFRTLFDLTDAPLPGESAATWQAREATQVERMLTDLNPDWLPRLPLLGDLLGLPIPDTATTAAFDPNLRQEALIALAVDILQTWAGEQPSLILLEDGQWLDEASQALTLALARVIESSSLALTLVQRPPGRNQTPALADLDRLPYFQPLKLTELSATGLAELVASRLEGVASNLLLALIQMRTQGHPFFIEELLASLHESGALASEGERWTLSPMLVETLQRANCLERDPNLGEWRLKPDAALPPDLSLPDTVHGAVLTRFDRLPEAQKVTLKTASAIGDTVEFDLLARAHPQAPQQEALLTQTRALEARYFVQIETPPPNLTYAFKHNITREVIYDTLLAEQRQRLHQAIGAVLEELHPDAVDRLAYHFSRSPLRDKTLHYLDKAARKAQRDYANETALNYYSQALELEEQWKWRREQVEVLHVLGRREEEQAALAQLAAHPQTPPFEPAYLLGQYYEAVGDYSQAQFAIEQALTAARQTGDRLNEVRCLGQLGLIARRQGDYDTARTWYEQALADFDEQQEYSAEEAHIFAQVLNGSGIVHRQQGEFDKAKIHLEYGLSLSRSWENRQDEAEILNSLGVTAYYQRHLSKAHNFYQQAMELRKIIGDRSGQGISLYNLALTTQEMGDYTQGLTYFSEALLIQKAVGNRWEEVNVWNGLGILYHELGDLSQSRQCLQRGLELAQLIGDEEGVGYILSNLGLVVRDQKNLLEAENLLLQGLKIMQKLDNEHQIAFFQSYLGTVSLQAGDFSKAIARSQQAIDLRQELGLRLRLADDMAILAAAYLGLDEPSKALQFANQVFAILEECGGEGPEFPQRDYFICYQVFSANGQEEQAKLALQTAYNLTMAHANNITDPALRQSFLENVAINREIVVTYEQTIEEKR